jgi:hypothetical protein
MVNGKHSVLGKTGTFCLLWKKLVGGGKHIKEHWPMLMGSFVFVTKQYMSKIKVSYDNTNVSQRKSLKPARVGERGWPLQRIQAGCEAQPASYSLGTGEGGGGFYAVVKRPQREADHLPPFSGEVMNEWRYTSTPAFLHGVYRDNFTCFTDDKEGRGIF